MKAETSLAGVVAFALTAELASFTAAGHALGISTSAVSRAVRGLERRVGARLLIRNAHDVRPTWDGRRLLATVGPAVREIRAALADLGRVAADRPPPRAVRVRRRP